MATDRAYSQRIRIQKIALKKQRKAESENREIAHAAACQSPFPKPVASTTIQVTIRIGDDCRVMRATFIPGFGWVGDSGNRMVRQIRVAREAIFVS
jgi:hypothetical protein